MIMNSVSNVGSLSFLDIVENLERHDNFSYTEKINFLNLNGIFNSVDPTNIF